MVCLPYSLIKASASGSAVSAYLRILGDQASRTMLSISSTFAVADPSARSYIVSGGSPQILTQ